jgi:hypothetical protein
MPSNRFVLGPIRFTDEEILEARRGNYAPVNKRIRKELPAHARAMKGTGRPRTKAELKRSIAGAAANRQHRSPYR